MRVYTNNIFKFFLLYIIVKLEITLEKKIVEDVLMMCTDRKIQ